MKAIKILIDTLYWLGFFIIPAGIFGFVSLWHYTDGAINPLLSGIIYVAGMISGILLAE
jgi:hypothetical protein